MHKQWFWVAALYKSVHLGRRFKKHMWERRVFLIRADTISAERIALKIAKSHEDEYKAVGGDMVRWVFQGVEDCQELFDKRIAHGTEVFWDFFYGVDTPERPNKSVQRTRLTPRR